LIFVFLCADGLSLVQNFIAVTRPVETLQEKELVYAMLAKECDAEQIAEELNKRATAGQAGFTLKLVQQVKTFTRNYLLQMQSNQQVS
jgi:hypothetical protein